MVAHRENGDGFPALSHARAKPCNASRSDSVCDSLLFGCRQDELDFFLFLFPCAVSNLVHALRRVSFVKALRRTRVREVFRVTAIDRCADFDTVPF